MTLTRDELARLETVRDWAAEGKTDRTDTCWLIRLVERLAAAQDRVEALTKWNGESRDDEVYITRAALRRAIAEPSCGVT